MGRRLNSTMRVLLALVLLALASVPAVTFASGTSSADVELGTLPSSAAGEIESAIGRPPASETNPWAADELPHRGLGREEALELLKEVFASSLQSPAGEFDSLDIERSVSTYAAVIVPAPVEGQASGSEEAPVLLESSIPLEIEGPDGKEPIDLSLEQGEGQLESAAPLVPIAIPQNLGEGIAISGSGIQIEPVGVAPKRSPSIIDESVAAYPNVETNTDFAVAPTPTGVETLTTLRAADAPRTQSFYLNLPPGASLVESQQGAEVVRAGETLLVVHSPSAMDAMGADVPVEMTINGNTLTLNVSPDPETAWPVLIDPLYESFSWQSKATTSTAGWSSFSLRENMKSGFSTDDIFHHAGPYLEVLAPRLVLDGDEAAWTHSVPRLAQEQEKGRYPTSYISRLDLSGLDFVGSSGAPQGPEFFAGIWDPQTGQFAGTPGNQALWGYPGNGAAFSNGVLGFEPGTGPGTFDEKAQLAFGLGFLSGEGLFLESGNRFAELGYATLRIGDTDIPSAVNPEAPSGWVNTSPAGPMTVESTDTGLGAKSATFAFSSGNATITNPCAGTTQEPCPLTQTFTLGTGQYSVLGMPNGYNYVPVTVTDVVGNVSNKPAKVLVSVDHRAPTVASLSGTVTEQGALGTWKPSYTLKYSASDGEDAAAATLPPFGTLGTGNGQFSHPAGIAADQAGHVWVVDKDHNRVEKFDEAGNYLGQFGATGSGNGQLSEPRGVAVTPSGNLWVTDLGNRRLEEFSPSGTYLRQFTMTGVAGFPIQPYGITTAPGGNIWITDLANLTITELHENAEGALSLTRQVAGCANHCGFTPLSGPSGLAADSGGGVWAADVNNNRIIHLGPSGEFISQFGTAGSEPGQFKQPYGVAIAPSGHLLVPDAENNRVQVFNSAGVFLRQFGVAGAGEGQLALPRGIAMGAGNTIFVSDSNNNRVSKWSHADLDPQSGAASTEVKVDGVQVEKFAPGCATRDCTISREWTLDANKFTAGQHTLEVIATDGVGLSSTSAPLKFESHPDKAAPAIALSGTMTEQVTLGTTRPTYVLKASATDPGGAEERKSGVASETIKVDGTVVKSSAPGCPAEGCSLSLEWTLESSKYSVGSHAVEVIATDSAGLTSTKSLTINIANDTTAPVLTATSKFFTAPEGWLEQKSYLWNASAKDAGGYGVTALTLKIDGKTIQTKSGACPAGGCELSMGEFINMATYKGGEHPAELIATDGAGNVAKKAWTINVDPKGAVTAAEATNTLEAVEGTVPEEDFVLPVAPTNEFLESQEINAGDNPGFKLNGETLESMGVPTSTVVNLSTEAVTITGNSGPLEIEPAGSGSASAAELVEGVAVVTPSVEPSTDTIVRPEYNGALFFTTIRDKASPEQFAWHVRVHSNQTLKLDDPQNAEVDYEDGTAAFYIQAEPARDATGQVVPTHLAIAGTDVILFVEHAKSAYVYPVTAGQAYETGYTTVIAEIPTAAENEEFPEQAESENRYLSEPPMNDEEFNDGMEELSAGLLPPPAHREKSKPVHIKEAHHIIRGGKPKAVAKSSLGGPGPSGGELEHPEEYEGGLCASFPDCSVWSMKLHGYYWRSTNYAVIEDETVNNNKYKVQCDAHVSPWWFFNLENNVDHCGHRGQTIVKRGSGKHLIYYVQFTLSILYVPEIESPQIDSAGHELVVWVFPNGYQVQHWRYWHNPGPEIQEA